MRLKYSCCGTKVAILGFIAVSVRTVAAAPVPFVSYPSFASVEDFSLFDSRMNHLALNVVGDRDLTVTIMFNDEPKIAGDFELQAPTLIFRDFANALETRLSEHPSLFVLPGRGSIPRLEQDRRIGFRYFVQEGLPLKFRPRIEVGAGSGYVQKNQKGVFWTIIQQTFPESTRQDELTRFSSPSAPEDTVYLVDSQMKRHSLDSFKDKTFQRTLCVRFHLSPDYKTPSQEAVDVYENIVTKLQPKLPEGTLVNFPAKGFIPPWNQNNAIVFDFYLTPGPPVPSGFKHLRRFGVGWVRKVEESSKFQLETVLRFQQKVQSLLKGAGDDTITKTHQWETKPVDRTQQSKVEEQSNEGFSWADYNLPFPVHSGIDFTNFDQTETPTLQDSGSTHRNYGGPVAKDQTKNPTTVHRHPAPVTGKGGGRTPLLVTPATEKYPGSRTVHEEFQALSGPATKDQTKSNGSKQRRAQREKN
ncbi:hypothetical protein F5878DRAFT_631073 [Lentinula raphanica]|uniref:Uncharacterized protein n=1 Tax=Lentinula raphanica TaxID=153919 RepID=A0AA38U8C8_9AGAR|nr:hypothetical protein F5878DRAFT_631073 [Lentinula raphanica]